MNEDHIKHPPPTTGMGAIVVPAEKPADAFSLDDDKPLVCNRDQSGDTTCESCQ